MRNMKGTSREVFLLIAPVIALFVFSAFRHQQAEGENARVKLFAQAIACEHLSRTNEGKQAARIKIQVSHQGTAPAWWGKSVNVALEDIQFHVPGKNTWRVPVSPSHASFDSRNRQYIVTFQRIGSGSQLFSLYRGTLRGRLTLKAAGSSEAAAFQFNRAFDNIQGQPAP